MVDVEELDAAAYARWRADGRAHVLLDVRDEDELARASIPGALHMPLREIPARAGEIASDRPIVVMCHHGGRSIQVAHFLAARGFPDVYDLDGGIDAYALFADPSIPRY